MPCTPSRSLCHDVPSDPAGIPSAYCKSPGCDILGAPRRCPERNTWAELSRQSPWQGCPGRDALHTGKEPGQGHCTSPTGVDTPVPQQDTQDGALQCPGEYVCLRMSQHLSGGVRSGISLCPSRDALFPWQRCRPGFPGALVGMSRQGCPDDPAGILAGMCQYPSMGTGLDAALPWQRYPGRDVLVLGGVPGQGCVILQWRCLGRDALVGIPQYPCRDTRQGCPGRVAPVGMPW